MPTRKTLERNVMESVQQKVDAQKDKLQQGSALQKKDKAQHRADSIQQRVEQGRQLASQGMQNFSVTQRVYSNKALKKSMTHWVYRGSIA